MPTSNTGTTPRAPTVTRSRRWKPTKQWFAGEGEKGLRQLAILRLLGLFDRPASADCLGALLKPPAIPELTERFFTIETRWLGFKRNYRPIEAHMLNLVLKRLEDAKLLTVNREEGSGELVALDAHPLLREYFATQLRQQQPDAWRAAHRRLYEHLSVTTKDLPQPTLEDLQPLYQAVAHGCQVGLQQESLYKVYLARILRQDEYYSPKKLGALGSNLGAAACFFETPWSRVSLVLTEAEQAWLLNEAAFYLRALGRLTEALEPIRAALEMGIKQENWKSAAIRAGSLSELELMLGQVDDAVAGERILTYTQRSGEWGVHQFYRASYADALHQAGRPRRR